MKKNNTKGWDENQTKQKRESSVTVKKISTKEQNWFGLGPSVRERGMNVSNKIIWAATRKNTFINNGTNNCSTPNVTILFDLISSNSTDEHPFIIYTIFIGKVILFIQSIDIQFCLFCAEIITFKRSTNR